MGKSVASRVWGLFDRLPDMEVTALSISRYMFCSYSTARTALRALYLDGKLDRRSTKAANGQGLEYHYKKKVS